MFTLKNIIRLVGLCLIIFLLNLRLIQAQGPNEAENPLVILPKGRLNLTFKQLGLDTIALSGHEAQHALHFSLPANLRILPSDISIDLITSQFPTVPSKPSSLAIELDGRLVTRIPITKTNSVNDIKQVDLPSGSIKPRSNTLALKLYTGGSCREPGAQLDLSFDGASSIRFDYQQVSYPTDLGLYPFPFTEQSLLAIPTTIVLPDEPTANDLSAVATIASGLGQDHESINLTAIGATEITPGIQENNHLIIIGTPETNSLLAELELPVAIDESIIQPGFGILEEMVSPWNDFRLVLIVGGLDDEGVGRASIALNRQSHFLGMRGSVAIIAEVGDLPPTTDLPSENLRLETLGYDDQVLRGVETQAANYFFNLPLGWQLDAPPFLHLRFNHADTLNPNGSVIDVSLNQIPIGSVRLTPENRVGGELIVSLPVHLLRDGRNQLQVKAMMNISEVDPCSDLDTERAWTVISSQSEIFLPYQVGEPKPDLRLFPYPFSQHSGVEASYFIVPDLPTDRIINELIQLAVKLGAVSQTDRLALPVAFASEVDDEIRKNHHLIVLGRPTDNGFFAEINDQLPHPFIPDSNVLHPLHLDTVVFLADLNRDTGLLQIIESPWDDTRTLMAIAGTSDTGVGLAVEALKAGSPKLVGNLAVVESHSDAFNLNDGAFTLYAIDTRGTEVSGNPIQPFQQNNALSSTQTVSLSERWWK